MKAFQALANMVVILKKAFKEFNRNEPLRMAAATAFFTTFALPAILIILIQVFGLVLNPQRISDQLFQNLSDIIGRNTVAQVRQTLRNVRHLASNWYIAVGGFIFLIFVSTTLFKVIKDSLNQLWKIKVKDNPGIVFQLEHRLRSFFAIMLAGLLFVGVLLAEGIFVLLKQYISEQLPENAFILNGMINQVISLIVVTSWFTMLFKYLADGRPAWRVTIMGAFFTGLFFTGGKLLLKFFLSYSNMQTIFGASTSMALMLLFVFYSSFIFYYGACFTKAYAEFKNQPIKPGRNAVKYTLSQVEMNSDEG